MDRTRYSTIAHGDHLFYNPVSAASVDSMIARLALAPGERVLDVGCGRAEILIRTIERFGVRGTGIDTSEAFLEMARRSAIGRVPEGSLVLRCVAGSDFAPGA